MYIYHLDRAKVDTFSLRRVCGWILRNFKIFKYTSKQQLAGKLAEIKIKFLDFTKKNPGLGYLQDRKESSRKYFKEWKENLWAAWNVLLKTKDET